MIKLALIGRNIQHSLSPSIYKNIYGSKICYDLLDYADEKDIPSAEKIFETYTGINITSPYKKHFLNEVELTENAANLKAINCLKKENGRIVGENTDYLAIIEILSCWKKKYGNLTIALLGDGVMSKVTEQALIKLHLSYRVFSRKMIPAFDQLNLKDEYISGNEQQLLIINTCTREYVFKGDLPQDAMFWDYNYQFSPHEYLKNQIKLYVDGQEMLELQAQYAISFWSLNLNN